MQVVFEGTALIIAAGIVGGITYKNGHIEYHDKKAPPPSNISQQQPLLGQVMQQQQLVFQPPLAQQQRAVVYLSAAEVRHRLLRPFNSYPHN